MDEAGRLRYLYQENVVGRRRQVYKQSSEVDTAMAPYLAPLVLSYCDTRAHIHTVTIAANKTLVSGLLNTKIRSLFLPAALF